MDIKYERKLQIEIALVETATRLKHWAQAANFVCIMDSPKQWSFRRGSHWNAIYTFDIRKIPTDVEISVVSENPTFVNCEWRVHSPLHISTSGHAKRISEQFDVLVAHLKGAL
jgi:hypothetical protein